LLLRLKADPSALPKLPEPVGHRVRTNSESLIWVAVPGGKEDHSQGIAINSLLQTDENSHLEMVRYGAGSGFFRMVSAPHVRGAAGVAQMFRILFAVLLHPIRMARAFWVSDFARATMILLYMRSVEGTLRFVRGRFGMATEIEGGEAPRPRSRSHRAGIAHRQEGRRRGHVGIL